MSYISDYDGFVEESARKLLKVFSGDALPGSAGSSYLLDKVKWSSWVISIASRRFAFKQACMAINRNAGLAQHQYTNDPTEEDAIEVIVKHICKRSAELKPLEEIAYYRLRFKKTNRWFSPDDADPLNDYEGPSSDHSREEACNFASQEEATKVWQEFYKFYRSIGLEAPEIALIGMSANLEEKNLGVMNEI